MKPDLCRLRQRIAAWGFRPGLWLGLCLCLFCCSVLPARALELVDSRGVTVRLERPAQRIIALYGAFNEILLALDARETLVARTAADAAIPGLQDLPAVGTHMRPNAELVAARQPDVVLQLAGRQEVLTQTEALEAAVGAAGDCGDTLTQAHFYHDKVFAAMQEMRAVADEIETLVGEKYWPYPTYGRLLFGV